MAEKGGAYLFSIKSAHWEDGADFDGEGGASLQFGVNLAVQLLEGGKTWKKTAKISIK